MIKDEELKPLVTEKLRVFIREFYINNAGNRLSKELTHGLAAFLEDFMVNFYNEIKEKEKVNGDTK